MYPRMGRRSYHKLRRWPGNNHKRKFKDILSNQKHKALNIVGRWCKKKGLNINPKKTFKETKYRDTLDQRLNRENT